MAANVLSGGFLHSVAHFNTKLVCFRRFTSNILSTYLMSMKSAGKIDDKISLMVVPEKAQGNQTWVPRIKRENQIGDVF